MNPGQALRRRWGSPGKLRENPFAAPSPSWKLSPCRQRPALRGGGGQSGGCLCALWHRGAAGIPHPRAPAAPHAESRQLAAGMERSCLGEDARKEGAGGAGLGERPRRAQGAAGRQGTPRESRGARGREQRAIYLVRGASADRRT